MHRDVKPENILIDERRHIKLVSKIFVNSFRLYLTSFSQIDFGDAKQYEDDVFDFSWEYGDSASTATQPIRDNHKEIEDGEWSVIKRQQSEPDAATAEQVDFEAQEDAFEDTFDQFDGPGVGRRDTFVGTPLYVSPEMLHETISLPASDLWALGCIIYRMHVGRVPFEDRSETGTFDKILNRQLEFPAEANLDEATKDIIDNLLQINPKRRLGSGRPGGPNDLNALKCHEYFASIDFDTLASQPSPLQDIPGQIVEDSQCEITKSATTLVKEQQNLIVREGLLMRKNEFRIE